MEHTKMKPASYFVDEWGLLDKKSGADGGDSCQREGMYFSLLKMIDTPYSASIYRRSDALKPDLIYKEVMEKIHVAPGVFVRHSNKKWDASDWDRMSRDQLQPQIIAAGYWSKRELKKIALGHLKRGFLFTNNVRQNGATKFNSGTKGYDYGWKFPGITGPEIWGNFIRAANLWYLWPLLLVFDFIELFWGQVKWRYWPQNNIAMNQTLSMLQAMDRLPTPFSWLATRIMPMERMINYIEDHFNDFGDDMEFFGPMFREALKNET